MHYSEDRQEHALTINISRYMCLRDESGYADYSKGNINFQGMGEVTKAIQEQINPKTHVLLNSIWHNEGDPGVLHSCISDSNGRIQQFPEEGLNAMPMKAFLTKIYPELRLDQVMGKMDSHDSNPYILCLGSVPINTGQWLFPSEMLEDMNGRYGIYQAGRVRSFYWMESTLARKYLLDTNHDALSMRRHPLQYIPRLYAHFRAIASTKPGKGPMDYQPPNVAYLPRAKRQRQFGALMNREDVVKVHESQIALGIAPKNTKNKYEVDLVEIIPKRSSECPRGKRHCLNRQVGLRMAQYLVQKITHRYSKDLKTNLEYETGVLIK